MGAGNVADVRPENRPVSAEELAAFRAVGEHLARRGLISGTEGNLSTFDGRRLVITRSGSRLDALGVDDVPVGTPAAPPAGASSDRGETPFHPCSLYAVP